jgi:hypothetical protein
MAMPIMTAIKAFHYRGQQLKPGDVFEALNDKEAKILAHVRRASYEIIQKEKPKPARTVAAAPPPQDPSDLHAKLKVDLVEMASNLGATLDGSETKADLINIIQTRRRRYARRDMQAAK